jgi:hypothetical protein
VSINDPSEYYSTTGFQPNAEDDAPGPGGDIECAEPVLPYSAATGWQVPFTGYALAAAPVLSETLGAALSGQVILTWTTPAETTKPIVGYRVSYNPSGALEPAFETVAVVLTTTLSLTSGDVYEISVQAITSEGNGDWSNVVVVTAP